MTDPDAPQLRSQTEIDAEIAEEVAELLEEIDASPEPEATPPTIDLPPQDPTEAAVLSLVAAHLGVALAPGALDVDGTPMTLDGLSLDPAVAVEIYTATSAIKSGQSRKILADAFRLATVAAIAEDVRLVMAFAGKPAFKWANNGWSAAALRAHGIETLFVDLDRAVVEDR